MRIYRDFWKMTMIILSLIVFNDLILAEVDGKKDLVQPSEKHYDGIPTFLQEPLPIYYVNKTHPAQIVCVAEPVSHVNIFCAEKQYSYMGEELSDSGLHVVKLNGQNKPDGNGKRWKFSFIIKFKDVVEWFSEYKCYCEAWNQIIAINKAKKVHSSVTIIQESYFQNKFKKSPQSQTIVEGSRLILSCVAPDAKPNAKILWLKDESQELLTNDRLVITDQDRQMLIEAVQKSDRGNYTCVAQSLGITKRSKPAVISVTSKYYWSEWTDWIRCPESCTGDKSCLNSRCTDKVRKRIRFCLIDGAKTNNENCKDSATEVESCDHGCDLSDKWKAWSKWSIICSPNCSQTRARRCNIAVCKGLEVQRRNCSDNLCQKQDHNVTQESHSTAMYLGLFITISVLFIVILVILCLIVQKGCVTLLPHRVIGFSSHNNGIAKPNDNKNSKSKKLLIQSGGNSIVTDHYSQIPVFGARLDDSSNTYSPVYEMYLSTGHNNVVSGIYPQFPSLTQPQFPYPSTTPLISNGISKDRSYNGHEIVKDPSETVSQKSPSTSALYQELSIDHGPYGILSDYLPTNIGLQTVDCGTISVSGGRLCLPQSGVSLTIPRGAIHHGNVEEVFLAVCRDQTIIPVRDGSEILLSPVIMYGPPHLRLMKSVIITLPHCANIQSSNWRMRLLAADFQNNDTPVCWKELSIVRPIHQADASVFIQLDPVSSHIVTSRPQMLCITGRVRHTSDAPVIVRLRFMVFYGGSLPDSGHIIRLHVVPDTKEAIENVMLKEVEVNGQLMSNPKKMSMSSSGDDINLCLEDLSLGWRCYGKSHVISRSSIWRLNHSKSCETHFLIERVDSTKSGFKCQISIQQLDVQKGRVLINIDSENSINRKSSNVADFSTANTIDSRFSRTYLDPLDSDFRLSAAVRQKLRPLLDPFWQILASHMKLNGNIKYFEEQKSPSDAILDLWEAKCREDANISELVNTLNVIGREDCAKLVEHDIMTQSLDSVMIPL